MKRHLPIGLLLLLALAAFTPSVQAVEPVKSQVVEPVEGPALELSSIDSLMWQRPDSALMCLLPFFDTGCKDTRFCFSTATEHNRHYAHLLLAELLYKNDCAQTNRAELQQAVVYFDSLCCCKDVPWRVSTDPTIVFLDARSHYINGVGYYENDSAVEACKEYLKALEIMDERFGEKELVGKKAIFMTYTYNRLTELFSEQFMMEPAIVCGERALMFCRIEPTSSVSVSNNLNYLGKQYDKMNDIDKARECYEKALEEIKDTVNLVYRNVVSSKAICDYLSGLGMEPSLEALKKVLVQVDDTNERLTRYLTIGGIFFRERLYDSALFYLEPVFYNTKDVVSKIQAAECLRVVYDVIGDKEKQDECVLFLADYKKTEGRSKALVSKLENQFKTYTNQKQEKQAIEEREKAIKKTMNTIIPIAVIVALTIFIVVKLRGKKLLKKQQEEADRILGETEQEHEKELRLWQAEADKTLEETKKRHEEDLETERLSYREEQEALRQDLQQREEQISALEKALSQQREEAELRREALLNELVCRSIINKVGDLHLTARTNYADHPHIRLDEATCVELADAVSKHFPDFKTKMMLLSPKLDWKDQQTCYLYLLGLNDIQIALLQQCHPSTVYRRADKLQKVFGTDAPLPEFIRKMAVS